MFILYTFFALVSPEATQISCDSDTEVFISVPLTKNRNQRHFVVG